MEQREFLKKIEMLELKVETLEHAGSNGFGVYFKKAFMKTHVIAGVLIAAVITSFVIYAATVSKPYTFVDGTTISAGEVNGNFDTLYNLVNGNLDDDNIKDSAGINRSKIKGPIMFSAGCTTHGQATGYNKYCINSAYEIDTMKANQTDGYIDIDSSGNFTVKVAGYYRIKAENLVNAGSTSGAQIFGEIIKNGSLIKRYYDSNVNTNSWKTILIDITIFFNANDTFYIQYQIAPASGSFYAYHAYSTSDHYSRVQLFYEGN